MDDLLFESVSSSFDGSMQHTNNCLESAIITCTEELLENHYVTEAVKDSLWVKFKQFFTKIILATQEFIKELELNFKHMVLEKQIKQKLHSLYEELKENKTKSKKIKMTDFWSMKKVYLKYYDELTKYAKKFSKIKYTKTWQIEDDLNAFNNLVNKCNSELKEAYENKIEMHIDKALDFVEDEIRGKSEVLQSLNDLTKEFAEIEQIAEGLKTRMVILGSDVIPKHMGFIQKMVNAISAIFRRWAVKFIMGVAFLFA